MDPRAAVTIADLRRLALRRMPRFVGGPLERGAGDGGGVRANVDAFRRHRLVPRHMVDVTPVEPGTSLFGRAWALPFGISAVGTSGIYRRDADRLLAQAAHEAGVPFILSGSASASIEQIARVAPDNVWFQLYAAREARLTDDMVRRARDAGVRTLVLTVDYPVPPRNEAIERSGVSLAVGPTLRTWPGVILDAMLHPRWSLDHVTGGGMPRLDSWAAYAPPGSDARGIARYYVQHWLGNHVWAEVERVRALWAGSLVVKGIAHPDDALQAVRRGADAVTVSNHGGNRLDCQAASLDVLAAVRAALPAQTPVLFDGGIRRGTDLVIARALGASFAFVGRASLYGVAAAGLPGARRALAILQSELAYAMAMIGRRTWASINAGCLAGGLAC